MVNLPLPDLVQAIYFPLNGGAVVDNRVSVSAVSTHDAGEPLVFPVNGCEAVGAFVRVVVQLPEGLHEGEWEYTVTSGERVLSQGLLTVGAMPADKPTVQYNKDIEYKEYGN